MENPQTFYTNPEIYEVNLILTTFTVACARPVGRVMAATLGKLTALQAAQIHVTNKHQTNKLCF